MNDNKLWKLWVYPFSLFGLMIIFVGLYNYLVDVGSNKCEMTYMYEYPIYTRLKLPAQMNYRFPQYGLYAYSEGNYASRVRRNSFHGNPVLFLPGNGGSYRQVRSLGSVSLRKSEDVNLIKWFDYFSIDFNEELSGLVGSLLEKQTQFATRVIDHVLSFYADGKKITLVGHSMGGIVARAILSRGYGDRIYLIHTQAAPHLAPPMAIDGEILAFYEEMRLAEAGMKRFDTPIVSVSGGRRDAIVPNHLTSLEEVEVSRGSLSVSTTSIPRVWASTDHLCVVWCKQLVLATVRSTFDLVDGNNVLLEDGEKKAAVLHHHFLVPKVEESRKVDLSTSAAAALEEETSLPTWRFHADRVAKRKVFKWSVRELKAHGNLLAIVGNDVLKDDSLLSCASTPMIECRTIPHIQRLDGGAGTIAMDLSSEPDEKYIALQIPAVKKRKSATVDFSLSIASAESVKFSPDATLGDVDLTFEKTANAMHVDLSSLWPYFLVKVLSITPVNAEACRRSASDNRVFVRLWVPWANDDAYYVYDCKGEVAEGMVLALETPRKSGAASDKIPVLSLFKTNGEAFEVTVSTSFARTVGHYFRFHAVSFIVYGYLSLWALYLTFTLFVDVEEVSSSWLLALATGLACCLNKVSITLGMILFSDQLKDFGIDDNAEGIIESLELYRRGLWTVLSPFVNFGVGFSGVVCLIFVFDKLTVAMKFCFCYLIDLSSRAGVIQSCLYRCWSLCLIISPLFNVSCSHLMCLTWMIARKRPAAVDPLRLDAIVILQRFFLFGLSFPSLVVLVKNLIETRFHSGYLVAEILNNLNTEHTCLGILMWTVLHFETNERRTFPMPTVSFFLFAPLLMTTEYSFRKCVLFDLSLWVISGCVTIVRACFSSQKRKSD